MKLRRWRLRRLHRKLAYHDRAVAEHGHRDSTDRARLLRLRRARLVRTIERLEAS